MRLGVDFGTTRIVVAAVVRGNYPVITFDGLGYDWFPPLVATRGAECLFGWDAWRAQRDKQATVIRSIKRYLKDAGPETDVVISGRRMPMIEVLTKLAASLRDALTLHSSLRVRQDEPLEVMLGVPANANANQRFLTAEAFRLAGFAVLGLLNEPSAASIEFSHAAREQQSDLGDTILVYDLGGGTFDASLVELDEQTHVVVASEGISSLGGDDFDDILAQLALETAGFDLACHDSLSPADLFWLHEECRKKKESLHVNSKRIAIDLDVALPGWNPVIVPVTDFYRRCLPLIDQSVEAVNLLLGRHKSGVRMVYVTGGGSELPAVARQLRSAFGDRVRRSANARCSTAIGLAIQADAQSGYRLSDQFTRNFGVWREAESGRRMAFDPLFLKGTSLPAPGQPPLRVRRRYRPAHNIGHFRYLECSIIGADSLPTGEIALWDDVLFPFDPALTGRPDLARVPVHRLDKVSEQEVEEDYSCDGSGAVTVAISNASAGLGRTFRLGRWAAKGPPVIAGKRQRKAARA
jgi:molecular chaperone DnaK (HSP70)